MSGLTCSAEIESNTLSLSLLFLCSSLLLWGFFFLYSMEACFSWYCFSLPNTSRGSTFCQFFMYAGTIFWLEISARRAEQELGATAVHEAAPNKLVHSHTPPPPPAALPAVHKQGTRLQDAHGTRRVPCESYFSACAVYCSSRSRHELRAACGMAHACEYYNVNLVGQSKDMQSSDCPFWSLC